VAMMYFDKIIETDAASRKRGEVMTQRELIDRLSAAKNDLKRKFGIEQIALFGSYARNEANEESDVDIAILKMNLKSGFDVVRAQNYLQNYLEMDVDLGTFGSMKSFVKRKIEKDFIYV